MKRPFLVIIVAVLCMLGGIKVLSGGLLLVTSQDTCQLILDTFKELKSDNDIPDKIVETAEIGLWPFKHHILWGIFASIKGLFVLVAAFYLLRLRAWARIGLEIIYWFDLVICSVSAVFIILMWKVFHSVMSPILKEMEISPEGMPEFSYMYNQMIYTSVSLAITLSFVILMIILLRWETVRNAVNPMKEEHNPIAPC